MRCTMKSLKIWLGSKASSRRLYRIAREDNPDKQWRMRNPAIVFPLPQSPANAEHFIVDAVQPWLVTCYVKDQTQFMQLFSLYSLHHRIASRRIHLPSPIHFICYIQQSGFILYCRPTSDSPNCLFRFDPREQGRIRCRPIQHSPLPKIQSMEAVWMENNKYVVCGYWVEEGERMVVCVLVRDEKEEQLNFGKVKGLVGVGIIDRDREVEVGQVVVQEVPRYKSDGKKLLEFVRIITEDDRKDKIEFVLTKKHFWVDYSLTSHLSHCMRTLQDTLIGPILTEFAYLPLLSNSLSCRYQHLLSNSTRQSKTIYMNLSIFFSEKQYLFYNIIEKMDVSFSGAGYHIFKLIAKDEPDKLGLVLHEEDKEIDCQMLKMLSGYCRQFCGEFINQFIECEDVRDEVVQNMQHLKEFHNQVVKRLKKNNLILKKKNGKYQAQQILKEFGTTSSLLSCIILTLTLKHNCILSPEQPLSLLFTSFNQRRKFLKYLPDCPVISCLFFQHFPQLSNLITFQPPPFSEFLKIIATTNPFLVKYFAYELLGESLEKGKDQRVIEMIVGIEKGITERQDKWRHRLEEIVDSYQMSQLPQELYLYLAVYAFHNGMYSQMMRLLEKGVNWILNFEDVVGLYASCRQIPRFCSILRLRCSQYSIQPSMVPILLQRLSNLTSLPLSLLKTFYHSI